MTTVCVIGLGKLGSSLAALLSTKGHDVVGVDRDPRIIDAVNTSRAPFPEPGLQELIEKGQRSRRLVAISDTGIAAAMSEIAFIVVPTPSGADGRFSNEYVVAVLEEIGRSLAGTSRPFTAVVVSTVMPGSMAGELRSALERTSGRTVGEGDLNLAYSPEFIALGSVIHDMTHPDIVLIGQDYDCGPKVGSVLASLVSDASRIPRFHVMNWASAELAKLSTNFALTAKITLANEIALACEAVPGADVDKVLGAVGGDSRIGSKFLRAGGPSTGPCLPRDVRAFASLQRRERPVLAGAIEAQGERLVADLSRRLQRASADGGTVGILGLSYKPGSTVTDAALGGRVIEALGHSRQVLAFDPLVAPEGLKLAESAQACVDASQVVLVANADPAFLDVDYAGKAVVDVWGLLPADQPNVQRFGRAS